MKFVDILRMVIRNLTKRKMRTFLTVSGVFIGTTAIIVMVSLGIGMSEAQDNMISEWADLTLITVRGGNGNMVYIDGGAAIQNTTDGEKEVPPLDDEMVKQFRDIKGVKAVTPWYEQYSGWQLAAYTGEYLLQTSLIGVDITQLEQFGYKLKEGEWQTEGNFAGVAYGGNYLGAWARNYTDDEYENATVYDQRSTYPIDVMTEEVFIIPMTMDDNYNPDYSVLGSKNSKNSEYEVELQFKGIIQDNGKDWYSQESIFVDISNIKNLVDGYNQLNDDMKMNEFTGVYDTVKIRAEDMNEVPKIEEIIQEMGYSTYSDGQSRENMRKQTQLIQMMLGALAAISLFVAALNITNTMIMAIVERTKEIGIMKVLGCDISKIRWLFLGEAAAIGFIGGVIGIIFSYIVSALMNSFLASTLMQMMGGNEYYMPEGVSISQIPPWLALLALLFATVVGVLAGFQPANRSVKISALSAISHD